MAFGKQNTVADPAPRVGGSPFTGAGGTINPIGLIASSATAASGRGLIHADPAISQRQQQITDWLNGVPQKLAAEQQTILRETEIGARAQRARQRAFASMSGYRGAGFDSTIATSPLGLTSNPMGKGNLGA